METMEGWTRSTSEGISSYGSPVTVADCVVTRSMFGVTESWPFGPTWAEEPALPLPAQPASSAADAPRATTGTRRRARLVMTTFYRRRRAPVARG